MFRMTARILASLIVTALGFGHALLAYADGMVVNKSEQPMTNFFSVKNHIVTVTIDDQQCTTEVDQTLKNVSGHDEEAIYLFPVPSGASITGFEIWVGDKKMDGEILQADKARDMYHTYARSKKDPALLEYVGQGVYRTSLFSFGKDQEKRLRIKYTELLKKDSDLIHYIYPLNTEKFSRYPLEEARIDISLKSRTKIKTIYSPSHNVSISRDNDTRARVRWSAQKSIPRTDFDLYFSTDDSDIGASVMTFRPDPKEPGYFMLLASPKAVFDQKIEPKDIVFVLDKSGSMRDDNKIGQAREALIFCLRSLNKGDRFNIVTFSNGVETYSGQMVQAADSEQAVRFVEGIQADGGTNIHAALLQALKLYGADERLKMVIFLTDGLPTQGVTNVQAIVKNVTDANKAAVRLFNFGVGFDVNTTLLDKLARQNKGDSEYVKPRENLEAKVSNFYSKVQSPVLSNLKLDWADARTKFVLPNQIPDLFLGGQIILVGRYEGSGKKTVTLTGTAQGKEQKFTYDVHFDEKSEGTAKLFIERLWAQRRIGDIIDRIQLYGKDKELVDEIVRLSTRYGIITEYTSFLIHEDTDPNDTQGNARRADKELDKVKMDTGSAGSHRAMGKAMMQKAAQAPSESGYMDAKGEQVEVRTVQQVGRKSFYQRNKIWQDSEVTDKDPVVEVKYFSDEFFKLLDEKPELNTFAARNDVFLVKIGGKAYKLVK